MNHWLLALPPDDMEHCIKIGTFGLNRKHVMGKVQKGDRVVCYAHKERKIVGLGTATSDYYVDDKKIFKGEGLFIDRFDINVQRFPNGQELDFMQLIDQMSFIKNLYYWSAYMRNGIIQISKSDWEAIESETKAQV